MYKEIIQAKVTAVKKVSWLVDEAKKVKTSMKKILVVSCLFCIFFLQRAPAATACILDVLLDLRTTCHEMTSES